MAPHQQRVVDEKHELDDKIAKLSSFLKTPFCDTLPEDEQERLVRQHSCMTEYSCILRERINAFPKPE